MSPASFQGKHIAVLGFGVEGQASVEYLLKHGAEVVVFDDAPNEAFKDVSVSELQQRGAKFEPGEIPSLVSYDFILRTPGVKVSHPALRGLGDKVTTATNIFLERCPATVIGVTGTKGKGTTATLIHEMAAGAGRKSLLGGNIGRPMLSFLDDVTKDDTVVLELSSFQLIDVKVSPQIALVLMVTSEHLDYHVNLDEYVTAKAGITRYQSTGNVVIVNVDYEQSQKIAAQSPARKLSVSARTARDQDGCYVDQNKIVLRRDGTSTLVVPIKEIQLPGRHNLENACAAVAAAAEIGVSAEVMATTLRTFRGLPHRLELVAEKGGIAYYNDSFATTPESTIAAVEAFDRPLILILGGSGKGSDFSQLSRTLQQRPPKAVIGIGDEWPRLKAALALSDKTTIVEGKTTMPEIVAAARQLAQPGDIVLLSPACASFGLFTNYKDRGDQFRGAIVENV